jgi:O-antigen/teichoic acid export membrane protein
MKIYLYLRENSKSIYDSIVVLTANVTLALTLLLLIPMYIREFGEDTFGKLSLIWTGVALLSLFELGFKNAIIYYLNTQDKKAPELVGNITTLLNAFLLILCLLVYLIFSILDVKTEYIYFLPIALIVVPCGMLRASLDAGHYFTHQSIILLFGNLIMFVGPLFSGGETYSILFYCYLNFIFQICCLLLKFKSVYNKSPNYGSINIQEFLLCFSYAKWLIVSNSISPIMTRIDRLYISTKFGVGSLANYVVPYELVTRILIVPIALMRVLFPKLTESKTRSLVLFYLVIMILLALSYSAVFFLFSNEIISLWLGQEFSASYSPIVDILTIGVFFNILAQLPITILQAKGFTKQIALLHVIELPFYLFLLFVLGEKGVEGVALAWTIRVTLDSFLLYIICNTNIYRKNKYD